MSINYEMRIESLERRVTALERPFTPRAKPGEIPFKVWVFEEAQRVGITPNAIYTRVNRGQYPKLNVRRVSGKIRYVLT